MNKSSNLCYTLSLSMFVFSREIKASINVKLDLNWKHHTGVVLWDNTPGLGWVVGFFLFLWVLGFFFLCLPPPTEYPQPQIRTARNFLVEKAQIQLSSVCLCANVVGTWIEARLEA